MKALSITNGSDTLTVLQDQMTSLEGFEYPSVKSVLDDVFGYVGAVYVTSGHGSRRLSLIIYQKDMCGDDRRTMLKVLRQNGQQKLLKFTTLDDLALQTYVEILTVKHPYNGIVKPFMLEMIAADFRFFSQDLTTVDILANATGSISNAGTAKTSPVYTITGPGTDISVINNDTTDTFLIGDLGASDEVEVDALNHTVKLNSVIDFSFFSGTFFDLDSGSNSITFSVPSGSTANTKLEIAYRNAYNGV